MHVALVGLGNIGSHAVPLLASIPEVTRLTLIDKDRYEAGNLGGQAIRRADVGRSKAAAQAARIRREHPDVGIEAVCEDVRSLPLGRLQCDVLLAAVDTRAARQYLNEACWTLGVPWIDSGVDPGGGLARINVFEPGETGPCLECGWDDRHYAALEASYPCQASTPAGMRASPHPVGMARTNAPAALGCLAAALLAIECAKVLRDERDRAAIGRQVVLDAAWHKHHVATVGRNPRCRFSHRTLPVASAPAAPLNTAIGELFARTPGGCLSVACAGAFAKRAVCGACGSTSAVPRLARGFKCSRCRRAMDVSGFGLSSVLRETDMPASALRRPLPRFGVREGDLVMVENGAGSQCVRIGAAHA